MLGWLWALCYSAGFIIRMKIKHCINLKFLVTLGKKKKTDTNKEEIDVLEDTSFTMNEKCKNDQVTSEMEDML